ncbi:hypothetical protein ACFSR6_20725 [Pedobacter vanadiisoli]|uniref:Ig-like domain-containing protein n=1 Tax=Pedobacter vanadiisoli TaxID=1761975 RepID=A0ABW5MTG4_9SPHI
MLKYIFMALVCLIFSKPLMSQSKWQPKGILHSDKNITVEIEYLISPNSYNNGDNQSYYRYKVTRIGKKRNYYINWRFDFFNCNNELKTQLNSLLINNSTKPGIFTPPNNAFSAKKMANYSNDVRISKSLPEIGSYKPSSQLSMEPIAISGNTELNSGESTTLTLEGGNLAQGDSWRWYYGNCGSKLIGTGTKLTITPDHSFNLFVRAEGKNVTNCISTKINVNQKSIAPKAIYGRSQICEGEQNVTLNINGGKLVGAAKWIWYANNCDGEKIGEGEAINVSPIKTTTYFVRAEDGVDKTSCQSFQINVTNKSIIPIAIDGIANIEYGSETTLIVHGGYLATEAKWVWYKGSGINRRMIGTGQSINTGRIYSGDVFSVRAEGNCNNTEFLSKNVIVKGTSTQTHPNDTKTNQARFFINGGIVFNNVSTVGKSNNFNVTIGRGKKFGWFAKAKFSSKSTNAPFKTNNTSLTAYNVPGYYSYNGNIVSERTAYTIGLFLGKNIISGYLGGGYGKRRFLWGINQYQYHSSFPLSSSYAENINNSFKGAEIEGGIMLRFAFLNLIGGVSSIQFKYTDFNIGIGFNF